MNSSMDCAVNCDFNVFLSAEGPVKLKITESYIISLSSINVSSVNKFCHFIFKLRKRQSVVKWGNELPNDRVCISQGVIYI